MSEHPVRTIERHCDVVVVGTSPDGLAAAAELARRHRSVIVLDPDGRADPSEAREQVRRHGGEVLAARAVSIGSATGDAVRVGLVGGHAVVARRLLVADPAAAPRTGSAASEHIVRVSDGDDVARAALALTAALDDDGDAPVSAHQADWDERYGGERLWSGNPNGTLVAEARELAPGRALDVGAGEGGDAIWLAEQGWTVTASDISTRALARIEAEAGRRGLAVRCLHADANAPGAFGGEVFDLVSAQYASIPRTEDDRATRNLLAAVAPGGTIVVVSHDLEPMRTPVDTAAQSRPFDPDAYVRVEDIARAIGAEPGWEVEVHETRPRPAGAASSHHVDDLVLRARRTG